MDEAKRKNRILEALSRVAALLLRMKDINSAMSKALRLLGKAVGVSRTYIFSNREDLEGRLLTSQRWEWVEKGINPQIDNPELEDFCYQEEGFGRWVELLSEHQPVYGLIKDFPKSERKVLKAQSIISLAVVPIFAADIWWGFIGFDDCSSEREWSEEEIDLLSTTAELIGAAIERLNIESQLRYWNEFNRNIVESTSVGVYVLDMDGRIQVWNRGMEDQFGVEAAEVLGEDIFRVFQVLQEEELGRILRHCLEEKTGYSESRLIHRTRRKGERILDVKITPLRDFDGRISGLVVINNDVTAQHEAEQKLAESEEMYRALSDFAFVGVYIYWEGRFLYVNDQMARITGYEVDELLKMHTGDLIAPDDRERVAKIVESRKTGEDTSPNYSFKIVCKDGSQACLDVYTRGISYQGQDARLGHCIDITDRIKTHDALQESEEKYRNLVERANDGIAILQETLLVYVNPRLAQMFGYTVEELLNTPFDSYLDSAELSEVSDRYRRRMAGEDVPSIYETVVRHKDGSKVYIEVNAGLVTYKGKPGDFVFIRDLTERKRAEEALWESEERYRSVVETAKDAIVSVNSKGEITFWNTAAEDMFGHSADEIVGEPITVIIPEAWRKGHQKGMERILAGEKGPLGGKTMDGIGLKKDGSEFPIELTVKNWETAEGLFFTAIIRDATERKKTEEELKQSHERLLSVLDSLDSGVYVADMETHEILFANRRMRNYFGDVEGKKCWKVLQGQTGPCDFCTNDKLLDANGQPAGVYAWEYKNPITGFWCEIRDRAIRWVDGRMVRLEIAMDITGRKRAEEELRESEERYRRVNESIKDVIFSISPEGEVIFVSGACQDLFGVPAKALIGRNLFEAAAQASVSQEQLQSIDEAYAEKVRNREESIRYELTLERDQEIRYLEINERIVYDEKGNVLNSFGVVRDITFRKRAEEALKESEEKFRAFAESAKDIIFSLDFEGRFTYVSPAMKDVMGNDPSELIGHKFMELDFISPVTKDTYRRGLESILKGESVSLYELELKATDGSRRVLEFSVRKTANHIVGIARDITARKEAEEALKTSERKFRTVIESSPMGMHMYRLEPDGRLVFEGANPAADKILGIDNSQFIGKTIEEAFPSSATTEIPGRYRLAAEKGTPWHAEQVTYEDERVKGAFEVYAFQTSPGKTTAMFLDITERKRAEEALKESEERFRQLAENIQEVFWLTDWINNKVLYVSPAYEEIWGYSPQSLLDDPKNWTNNIHPQDRERVYNSFMQNAEIGLYDEVYRIVREDGEMRWIHDRAFPIKDETGRVWRVAGISEDITYHKMAEEALRESEEKYSRLFQRSTDAILIHDLNGNIIDVNEKTLWLFGYTREEILLLNMFDLHPPDALGASKRAFEKVSRDGSVNTEIDFRKKNGEVFPAEVSSSLFEIGGRKVVQGIVRDITERKRAENELGTLLEISTAVSASLDEKEVTRLIAERATELIGADGCTIYKFDHKTKELVPKTTTIQQDREKRLSYRVPLGKGITGKAALERIPILANNVHLGDEAIRIPGAKEAPRCLLVAPLIAHGELWGVMTLIRFSQEGFVERDLELLGLFANQVADAAVNSTLFSLLGESEEKYRSFVEQAIDGIVIIQDGRFVFANRATVGMIGYALEELIGMEFIRVVAPEVRKEMNERYKRRMRGDKVPNVYETKLLTREGKVIDVELNAGLVQYEGLPADLVFARDIRDRKQAELRREVRARLIDNLRSAKTVNECLQLGCEAIREAGLFNRAVLALQNEAEQITHLGQVGLDPEVVEKLRKTASPDKTPFKEMLSDKFKISHSYFIPREAGVDFSKTARYMPQKSPTQQIPNAWQPGDELFVPVLTHDGATKSYLSVDTPVDGKRPDRSVILYLENIVDLVIRQVRALQNMQALQESEERYRTLHSNVPVGLYRSTPQGNILSVNPSLVKMLGYDSEQELLGISALDTYLIPEQRKKFVEMLETEGSVANFEVQLQRKDGSVLWVSLSARAVIDDEGNTSHYDGIMEDITERKRAEEALRSMEREKAAILDSMSEHVIYHNPQMKILWANRAAAESLGLTPDQLVGKSCYQLWQARGEACEGCPVIKARDTGIMHESEMGSPDGRVWSVRGYPVKNEKGDVVAMVETTLDITERKRAEQALKGSEERYKSLFEDSPIALWEEDLSKVKAYLDALKDKGVTDFREYFGKHPEEVLRWPSLEKIVDVNKATLELYGAHSKEELIEGIDHQVLCEESYPALREQLIKIAEGKMDFQVESVNRTLRGEKIYISLRLTVAPGHEETLSKVLISIMDITERKRSEEALRESEEQYRTTLDSMGDAIHVVDADSRIILFNTAFKEWAKELGLAAEVIGKTVLEAFPFLPDRIRDEYHQVFATGKTLVTEENTEIGGRKFITETRKIPILEEGKVSRVVTVIHDITERRQAEKALKEREELYRTLVNSAEEGIGLVDSEERLLFVNPKMANLMGYSPAELKGRNLLDFIPSEDVEFVKEESAKRAKGQTSRYETTLIHKDGTPKKVLVNAVPILEADGRFTATLGVLTDITDIKKTEDELRLRLIYQTAFAQIMNRAIRIENLEGFINGCLEILGSALDVSRIYLVTNRASYPEDVASSEADEDWQAQITNEWLSPGVSSLLGTDYSYSHTPYVKQHLLEDELVVASVSSLPSPDYRVFDKQKATGVMIASLHLRNGFYGFIAAQECRRERRWSDSEVQAFRTAVRLIGTVIERYFEEQERRVAEQALSESEQRYRTLVETSSDIIFLISPQGKPLYISPAAAKLGYAPQDFLNRPRLLLKVIPKDELRMLWAVFAKTMREGHPAQDVDCEVYDSEGHSHWFSVSWNWMRDDEGRSFALQGVARDITERKQTERALRLRMEYEKVLFEISSLFLSEGISDASLAEFLQRLGKVTGVSRVYLFSHQREDGRAFMKREYRWVSEETPNLDNDAMDKIYYDEGFDRWLKSFSTGEPIRGLTEELPASEREIFEAEGILAILVLPIFVEGSFWGAIGFDEAKRKREWSIEDIRLLWTASQILSSALATESKAKELALSYDDLQERERRISELNVRLVQAEEDERRRLSQVLHDEVAQQLTGVALTLSAPELIKGKKVQERLKQAKEMVKQTQNFIRGLSYDLRPPALDNLGLVAAIRALARSVAEATGVSFVMEGDEDFPRTETDTEIMLYRIIQEAVNNSLRHAEPEEITVRFEYSEPKLRITVTDDGKGFDVESVMAASTGLGLRSIHERVALIGGKIDLSSSPGKGTRVSVEVEIPRNPNKMSLEE